VKALRVLFFVLVPFAAFAEGPGKTPAKKPKLVACPEGAKIEKEIYNCGRNSFPVKLAKVCEKALTRQSEESGHALADLMSELNSSAPGAGAQGASLEDARSRLGLAISNLTTQIHDLQQSADRVARYTLVMIDAPDGVDDETSLDCFSENFHALQDVVTRLDKEIVDAEAARAKAIDLAETLGDRAAKLTGPGGKSAHAGKASRDREPAPAARKQGGASDITGLPAEEKR
jgi:hypothetical protein